MFKLTQSPRLWAEVQAEMQSEGGNRVRVSFEAQFKRMDVDEVRAFAEGLAARIPDSASATDATTDALMEVVTDFRGVAGEDGEALTFSRENLRAVVALGLGPAILDAFYRALPKARAKN